VKRADLLLTSAQIGMALAAFAGLVTLLGRPGLRADTRLNEIRFRSMVELSLMLAAFSLLPFVPSELGVGDHTAWRVASAIYSAAGLVFVAHSVRRNRAILGRVLIVGGVTGALLLACGAASLVLALNAIGLFAAESGVYFAVLFLHFLAASFFFIRLLYGAFPREDPPGAS
jgi:hypothetical protein